MFKSKAKQVADFFSADAKDIREETSNLGGMMDAFKPDASQLAGMAGKLRVVVSAGNLVVINILHNKMFVYDSLAQYLNRALLAHGVCNVAADACGYFLGTAIQSIYDNRAIRAGCFPQYKTGVDNV